MYISSCSQLMVEHVMPEDVIVYWSVTCSVLSKAWIVFDGSTGEADVLPILSDSSFLHKRSMDQSI